MVTKSIRRSIEYYCALIDWRMLAFLLLFMNVKLVVKLAALIFIYLIRPDLRFGFRLKNTRLPLFYPLMMGFVFVDWLLQRSYADPNYWFTMMVGIAFWAACILAIHQTRLFVQNNNAATICRTLVVFFVCNAFVSLGQMLKIIIETGALNPYRFQGLFQKYFMNTGDYIKGLSFDTSTTNAVLNAFGIVYFLARKKTAMVFLCLLVFLSTASNIMDVIVLPILLLIFIFQANRDQKSILVACFCLFVVFFAKVSPENGRYMGYGSEIAGLPSSNSDSKGGQELPVQYRPDSVLNEDQKKQKLALLYLDSIRHHLNYQARQNADKKGFIYAGWMTKPELPKDDINSYQFQHINDTTDSRKKMLEFIAKDSIRFNSPYLTNPGKITSFLQTMDFLRPMSFRTFFGNGAGRFSSKLAFRATGLNVSGGYPARFTYISRDFLNNHFKTYLYYFSRDAGLHSVVNNPGAVYNQLAGEYGILGIVSFVLLYMGFFLRKANKLTYGLPVLMMLVGIFFLDYWFEQLSVVIMSELLLFANQKEMGINEWI